MSRIAYYRVSTKDQTIDSQRIALGGVFDREFIDDGVSGGTLASDRPAFAQLMDYIRDGDELHVYAIDRLGRDAIDVQATVRKLLDLGVTVNVHGLGPIGRGVGELIVAVLAQVANMEKDRIRERCDKGREAARDSLERTGRTHRGKAGFGRKHASDATAVQNWRNTNQASIVQTAAHFGISISTVKRYCALCPSQD